VDDIFSLMENIVAVAVPEIQVPDNNGVSTTYPSLNRFIIFRSFSFTAGGFNMSFRNSFYRLHSPTNGVKVLKDKMVC